MTTRQLGEVAFAVLGVLVIAEGMEQVVPYIWMAFGGSGYDPYVVERELLDQAEQKAIAPVLVGGGLLVFKHWLARLLFPAPDAVGHGSVVEGLELRQVLRLVLVATGLVVVIVSVLGLLPIALHDLLDTDPIARAARIAIWNRRGLSGHAGEALLIELVKLILGLSVAVLALRLLRDPFPSSDGSPDSSQTEGSDGG